MSFDHYRLWIFDCDGVLLDSNRMKTAAFAEAVSDYPEAITVPFLAFQKTAFGLSRFRTMDAFFDRFLKRPPAAGEKETLLNSFAQSCARDYPLQPVTAGAPALLNTLTRLRHPCYIASGSEQSELRTVLREIGLAEAFRDILGSPRKKSELVQEILAREPDIPRNQALFIGDARADFEAADANGIDFLQVEAYASDPEGMAKLRRDRGFRRVVSLADIVLSPLSAGIK